MDWYTVVGSINGRQTKVHVYAQNAGDAIYRARAEYGMSSHHTSTRGRH